jgi:hypothetical protein
MIILITTVGQLTAKAFAEEQHYAILQRNFRA